MIVSPSRPQAVVFGVASNVRGRYDAVFVPMFKYRDMVWLWMVDGEVLPCGFWAHDRCPRGTGQAL
jgi:hypothetical protein